MVDISLVFYNKKSDYIKTYFLEGWLIGFKVYGGSLAQVFDLPGGDCFFRCTEAGTAPGLDLNKNQGTALTAYYVQLSITGIIIPSYYVISSFF